MIDMETLKFDEKGLIPAIVVDGTSGQVLTLAYMNKESLEISIQEERTCFWSRSRQELWRKGETSGNAQHIIDITADCDYDALVVRVNKDGPACHTGAESCFHNPIFESDENSAFSLEGLMDMLQGRKDTPKEGSYTSYLFDKGLDKILKKVGEESTEVIIQKGDDLRDRRPGLPRHGPHAPAGHLSGRCAQGAGLPPRHRQESEAGENDLILSRSMHRAAARTLWIRAAAFCPFGQRRDKNDGLSFFQNSPLYFFRKMEYTCIRNETCKEVPDHEIFPSRRPDGGRSRHPRLDPGAWLRQNQPVFLS